MRPVIVVHSKLKFQTEKSRIEPKGVTQVTFLKRGCDYFCYLKPSDYHGFGLFLTGLYPLLKTIYLSDCYIMQCRK